MTGMFGLADLVAPLGVSEFLTGPWPEECVWHESSATRAALLRNIPELGSAAAVLSSADSVGVFVGGGNLRTVPAGEAAIRLYEQGRTCFVRGDHIPRLATYAQRITLELGLPQGSMHPEVFCSKGDSGAPMHSDYDVNFTVLVRGNKKWRLAPNRHIRNQVNQCFPAPYEKPDSIGTRLADQRPFPTSMPEDAHVVDIAAGGLVFVPRGWWHETESRGECLQVNFVVKRFMWLTIVSRAIRNMLLERPEWRAYAVDIFATDGRQDAALDTLAELLPELWNELDTTFGGDPRRAAGHVIEMSGLKPAGHRPRTDTAAAAKAG
ncbi:cupin-like domain-containing protein [Embleya sp. NPDC056575]|uniref:cupin-like domain-containing protein n=1 Tax=unclassified Embleya TaxID=2699296 RepID=UPI0036B19613